MYQKFYLKLLSALLLAVFSLVAGAAEKEVEGLMMIIEQRQADPASNRQAMRAGRDRALLCSYCHGSDGNSVKPEVPNLAGQNPVYLLGQINRFADGRRKNFVMNSLAREFTLDDKVNLAIYYASQSVEPRTVDAQQSARGKRLYGVRCVSCHGERGHGSTEYARLAGQQPAYMLMTLKRFRATARGESDEDQSVRRSPVMESMVKDLEDAQLKALVAYLSGLD